MKRSIREALGIKGESSGEEEQTSERHLINKDRREIDLLSVLSSDSGKVVFQAETKSDTRDTSGVANTSDGVLRKDINTALEQLDHFKDYMERIHGPGLRNYWYLPAVALPRPNASQSSFFRYMCFCNTSKPMPVAEIEFTESQLEPSGTS